MGEDVDDQALSPITDAQARTPEQQTALVRSLAAHQVTRLEKMSASSSEQLIKVSGWLSAALLTINGAGAIATLNIATKLTTPIYPAGAFATGILLILLNGVAVQGLASLFVSPLERLMAYWRAVEVIGHYDEGEEEQFRRPVERLQRFSWIPPALGWASGVCFFGGVSYLALNV